MSKASDQTSGPDKKAAETDAIVIKAFHGLKIKTGPGGFDPMNVKKAERRLESASHLFPQAASYDIALIEEILANLPQEIDPQQKENTEALQYVLASVVELKAQSTMFRFPLVTQILENLLPFCLSLSCMTPLARDVIAQHLRALHIAIDQGPRAITPEDRVILLSGLEKAVAKVLRKQGE